MSLINNATTLGLFLLKLCLLAYGWQCLQCDSASNDNCIDLNNLEATDCTDNSTTKCFTESVGGIIIRGCHEEADTSCLTSEYEQCILCAESGCNNHRICKSCTAEDPKCSQSDVQNMMFNQICESATSKCLVQLKDKRVERRCATTDDVCKDGTTCNLCSGSNCNAFVFPVNRIRCYHCSGSQCNFVFPNKVETLPCLNYVDDDKCFSIGQNSTSMTRGCQSDAEPQNLCPNNSQDAGCLFCNTDNCNNLPYRRDQRLKCIQCSSPGKNFECFNEQLPDESKNCQIQILYNDPEICYTFRNGGRIKRGCFHDDADLKIECKDSLNCKTCNDTHGCNHKAEPLPFTCIVCRSDLNWNCWNNAYDLEGQICRRDAILEEDMQCFHGIWNNVAIRGCLVDADERMKLVCLDAQDNQCHVCEHKDCNRGLSSGYGALVLNSVLYGFTIAILLYSFKFF